MNEKIHILQFVPDLGKSNGIPHVLMQYFNHMHKKVIFDFVYFNESNNSYKSQIEQLGGRVFKLPSPIYPIKFIKQWRKFCKNNYGQFDILENNLPFLGVYFRGVKDILGVKKIISHSHVTRFGDNRISNLRNRTFFLMTGKPVGDVIFSCSKDAGLKIFGEKCFLRKWHIINNAFETSSFNFDLNKRNKIRESFGWKGKKVIGNVGRLVPQKNQFLILETFSKLKIDNAILVFIGEGPLRESLENKAQKLGIIQKVFFLGNRNNVNELLQGFDVFFFPSIFEGLGVSLIEAEIERVPVIISNTIPKESIISTKYISEDLTASPLRWALQLKRALNMRRETDCIDKKREGKFDINTESIKLINTYIKILRSK